MSCLTVADLLNALAGDLFDMARESVWGDAALTFENKDKATLATVAAGWEGYVVTSEATGIPELELNVRPQAAVTEAMLDAQVRFVVLQGRRHEKRTYEYRTDAPERHQLRFKAIGEAV